MRRAILASFVALSSLGWSAAGAGAGGAPSLATALDESIDARLTAALADASARASEWQPDARLREIRLNLADDGTVSWRFLWLSDAAGASMQSHSDSSLRSKRPDPEAGSKQSLDVGATVGFAAFAEALETNGVDPAGIRPEQIQTIQLGYETHLDPPGFYYYLFLTSGEQHWVRAADASFVE